ncbi:MAG: peroxiredoxin family protein [Prevotella sp.]
MRTITLTLLCLSLPCLLYSQKSGAGMDGTFQRVEQAFNETSDIESLRDNPQFMADLKAVIAAADEQSARTIVSHSTFVFMNGLLNDVGAAISRMPKGVLSSENGMKAADLYNSLHLVDVGMAAPDFTLSTPDGKEIHFADFLKGKKCVLVDFWASWCGWCRKENPNVRAAYDEFKDKGFDVLSVSLDTKDDAWRKALDEDKPSWPQVVDYRGTKEGLYKWYNLHGIPAILLIGSDGVIVAKGLRGANIRKAVVEYLDNH